MADIRDLLQTLPAAPPPPGGWREFSDYYPIYEQVIGLLTPRSVLEIGTFVGDMLVTMLRAAPSIRRVAWVDSEEDHAGTNAMAAENIAHYLAIHEPGRTVRYTYHDDVQAVPKMGRYSLVHVDGDHSFVGCRRDLTLALDHARPKWLLADDMDWSAGVGAAIRDVAAEREMAVIHVPTRHGLAIMMPGVRFPGRPQALFDRIAALGLKPNWVLPPTGDRS